jgi:hypothetical protein
MLPAANSHDLFLAHLLRKQVNDFNGWIDVEELLLSIGKLDCHDGGPFSPVPEAVFEDIRLLERHKLLHFRPENPHVKLTALGIFTALLFDVEIDPQA